MKASHLTLTAMALAFAVTGVGAAPPAAADEACAYYAVDNAAFKSCGTDGMASGTGQGADQARPWLDPARVSARKRTLAGYYVDARGAYDLKSGEPATVILVDVRSRLEAGLTGQPRLVDVQVPFQEIALPLQWDEQTGGWALEANPNFVAELDRRLRQRGATVDTSVILICRSGDRSARAADLLAAAGYPWVITVVDGFEGDVGADGRRSVNGWKNAGLPWSARADRVAYSGEVSR